MQKMCGVASFKNFENNLTTVKVMTKTKVAPFYLGHCVIAFLPYAYVFSITLPYFGRTRIRPHLDDDFIVWVVWCWWSATRGDELEPSVVYDASSSTSQWLPGQRHCGWPRVCGGGRRSCIAQRRPPSRCRVHRRASLLHQADGRQVPVLLAVDVPRRDRFRPHSLSDIVITVSQTTNY